MEELTLEELKAVSELFEADVYDALNLENCMALRSSYGGRRWRRPQGRFGDDRTVHSEDQREQIKG